MTAVAFEGLALATVAPEIARDLGVNLFGPAVSIGAGVALVAAAATSEGGLRLGVEMALVPGLLLAALALVATSRMPGATPAGEPSG